MPDIATPEELVKRVSAHEETLASLALRLDETQSAIAQRAGAASVADPQHVPGTLAAWTTDAGAFAFDDCQRHVEVEVDGVKQAGLAIRPGYLSRAADSHVPAEHREPRAAWRKALGGLAALDLVYWRGSTRSSAFADVADAALAAAERMPGDVRAQASTYTRQHLDRIVKQAGALSRRDGAFIANTSGSSTVGADFVNPEFIDNQVLDVTSVRANTGLARALRTAAGLHEDEYLKVRVLTSVGGFAGWDSPTSNNPATFPITDASTTTTQVRGGSVVWSHLIAEKDLMGDPRVTIDMAATLLYAGEMADMAEDDGVLLHGHQVSGAASHMYAAAGLAALAWDGRDASRAGTDIDPFLRGNGIIREAIARSATLNAVSGAGLSAATDWLGSVANFVKAHTKAMATLDEQYAGSGVVLTISRAAARKLGALVVTTTATTSPFFVPATAAEKAANQLYVGMLWDGTIVMEHVYMASGKWSTGGLINGSGAIDAAIYSRLDAMIFVTGSENGRVIREIIPRTAAVSLSRMRHKIPFCPVPTAKKPFVLLFNVSAQ